VPFPRDRRDEFADLKELRCSRRPVLIALGYGQGRGYGFVKP
jgi:hypothetical protein